MARTAAPARRAPTRRSPRRDPAVAEVSRASAWTRYARALFLVPALLYVLFAFAVPIIYNLILSFEQTSPATIASLFAPFAGLSNYKATLVQATTQSAIARTFIFTAGSLFFQFIIGFSLALLFNLRFPFRRLARSLIIIPWLLPLLITGFIFRFLFQAEAGAINQILADLHLISHPIGFLTSPGWAFATVLIANIWIGVPFFTVLLYSALAGRADRAEGGGDARRGQRVAAPLPGHPAGHPAGDRGRVHPGFVFTIKVFDVVIGLTQGGPANSTQILAPWAYQALVPAVQLRRGRCAQHHPAGHRPGGRAGLHLAEPRDPAEGMT